MKEIYIVLTHTGTSLSRIIKYYTKDEFSHVSIALDLKLRQMYSFGRLHPYNPFWGGLVHEQINQGTFKRFYKTISAVYALKIRDEQYQKIRSIIEKMEEEKERYKFNIIGLIAVAFHKKIKNKTREILLKPSVFLVFDIPQNCKKSRTKNYKYHKKLTIYKF